MTNDVVEADLVRPGATSPFQSGRPSPEAEVPLADDAR
jgi:hypothetical protein